MGTDRFSRVFEVLELLVSHPEGLTLTEISRRLEPPTSSGHNLLQRMVGADVLALADGPRYSVGGRAIP
jgi:DNA-binding IclR family transcriptional regulator